jgi:F-type H+-transporting ATPase subunit b
MEIYPNFTLFFQIANFLFLLFVLNILLYRPIRKILGQRRDEMNSFEEMIEDFQGKSTQYAKELEENMVEARSDGYKEKETLKNAGLDEEKGMLREATSKTEAQINKAKEEIQRKALDARQSLEEEVAGFSRELAKKILGRSI